MSNIEINMHPPVSGEVEIGEITLSARINTPVGWLDCDGSSIDKNDYPDLFDELQYTFGGSGDNFNIPTLADYATDVKFIIFTGVEVL